MRVICHTNLDLSSAEQWPDDLDFLPHVGDEIVSAYEWNGAFQLCLQVVKVRFERDSLHRWTPHIELHMTKWQQGLSCSLGDQSKGSIRAFYEWYGPKVGRTVESFI